MSIVLKSSQGLWNVIRKDWACLKTPKEMVGTFSIEVKSYIWSGWNHDSVGEVGRIRTRDKSHKDKYISRWHQSPPPPFLKISSVPKVNNLQNLLPCSSVLGPVLNPLSHFRTMDHSEVAGGRKFDSPNLLSFRSVILQMSQPILSCDVQGSVMTHRYL